MGRILLVGPSILILFVTTVLTRGHGDVDGVGKLRLGEATPRAVVPAEVCLLDHDVAIVLARVAQESDRVVVGAVTYASRATLLFGFPWDLKRIHFHFVRNANVNPVD